MTSGNGSGSRNPGLRLCVVPDATTPLLKRIKHLRLVWTTWQNPRKKEITEEKKSEIKKRNPVLADSKYRSHFSIWGFVVQWELQGSWDPLGTCHKGRQKAKDQFSSMYIWFTNRLSIQPVV